MKILLIDDEESIAKAIGGMVERSGYDFIYAADGESGISLALKEHPDLIIMDVMMPDVDGFIACRRLRAKQVTAPIIFLSAKGDIVDKGVGFQAGGDDYMTKPFDPRELMMHVDAQLRRANMGAQAPQQHDEVLHIGRFVVDPAKFSLTKDGEHVPLTPKEFKIFYALAENPGAVLSKEQIIEAVWGPEYVGNTSSLTVFIKKLREKVEDDPSDPRVIQTLWGVGYCLNPEECKPR